MSYYHDLHDAPGRRPAGINVPTIWLAIIASVLIHALLMSGWLPWIHWPENKELAPGEDRQPLVLRLVPPRVATSKPPPAPAVRPQAPPAQSAPRSSQPPVLAMKKPVPEPAISTPPQTTEPPPRPAEQPDMAAMLEARRRAREASGQSPATPAPSSRAAEDESTRANRIAAANLAATMPSTFGYDPSRTGGVFQIQRMSYDYAEFVFFGWHKDIKRRVQQVIEVRKGTNADIRIAVVRRMISIIREYEQEDFVWESRRLGRNVTLSARQRDNAGLEEFMLQEFFATVR